MGMDERGLWMNRATSPELSWQLRRSPVGPGQMAPTESTLKLPGCGRHLIGQRLFP